MGTGWILRVLRDLERDRYVLVIREFMGRRILRDLVHHPSIYVSGDREDLRELLRGLEASDYLVDYAYEEWLLPPWYRRRGRILRIDLPGPREYDEVLRHLRLDGRYRLWNTYPSDTQMMMYRMGIAPSLLLRTMDLHPIDNPWEMNYLEPGFRRVVIRLLDWYGEVVNPWAKEPMIYEVSYNVDGYWDEAIYRGLDSLIDDLREYDPDVVEFTSTSAYVWLRERDGFFRDTARAYIDYERNVLEPHEYHGFIELSRLSRTDIHEVSRYSIGKILTTIEAYEALSMGRAIPEVRTEWEGYKDIKLLSRVDRGGYIASPRPGLYWNVAQCDFTSLYPSIIVRYNIGNETVNRPGCSREIRVPEAGHRICLDTRSVVASTLEKLLKRRIRLKDMARETGDPILNSRQNALKWILVTCFGYLGYRNARFGKIEAYESVTSYARHIMYRAAEIAREMGLEAIHILVDSIWVSGGDEKTYRKYCIRVTRETGFRMELEALYRWLYIPPNRSGMGEAAINRYVGGLVDGGYKAKGVEMVRSDVPRIVAEFQRQALALLARAENPEEMERIVDKIPRLIEIFRKAIMKGEVELEYLVVTRRLSKKPGEYLSRQPHVEAAKKLGRWVGKVKYILTSRGAVPVELWKPSMGYDVDKYVEMMVRSLASLPVPLERLGL